MLQYTLKQRVFPYDTYVKYWSARNCQRKFHDERVPSRQTIHNLGNKLRTTGLLIKKKKTCAECLLRRSLWHRARPEHIPRKSLKHLAQVTGVSKSITRTATQLLKLRPYKTVINPLQQYNPASSVYFCSLFLQSVIEGEIDPQLTLFSDDVSFHLLGYINTQNNCYWSSQNPHLTNEVPLHLAKVGVWCAVSARRIVVLVFLTKQLIAIDV
jgi:hypothetical protein